MQRPRDREMQGKTQRQGDAGTQRWERLQNTEMQRYSGTERSGGAPTPVPPRHSGQGLGSPPPSHHAVPGPDNAPLSCLQSAQLGVGWAVREIRGRGIYQEASTIRLPLLLLASLLAARLPRTCYEALLYVPELSLPLWHLILSPSPSGALCLFFLCFWLPSGEKWAFIKSLVFAQFHTLPLHLILVSLSGLFHLLLFTSSCSAWSLLRREGSKHLLSTYCVPGESAPSPLIMLFPS